MATIKIDQNKCKGCMLCVSVCPLGLIEKAEKLNKRGVLCVQFKKDGECSGCSMCAIMCPDACIEIEK